MSHTSSESPNGDRSSPGPILKVEQTASSTAWLENLQHPKLYHPDPSTYALTRQIADLPLIRPLTLRPGKEIFYLHNLSHGLSNYKTALAYQRGKVQSVTCSCCIGPNPLGPYQQCVVLGTVHTGACTNCAYDGNGTRCTLRVTNSDGTSINPNSLKRKQAIRREQTVDRTIKEVINVETGTVEDPRLTPAFESGRTASPSPHTGYIRRQAAKDAESRLSNYTYRAADIGGSAIESDAESRVAEHASIEGWPDLAMVVSDLPQPEAQRPRGSFMAKRGGKHSHMRMKSGSSEDARRARTTTLEGNQDSDDDEPVARRRRIYTSPTPGEEETHISVPNSGPVPDNLRLQDIPLPARLSGPTAVMKHLLQQPALRNVAWKKDSSRSLNINAQVEAAMGYCVGEIVSPCDRCSRDLGAFQQCITVTGNFQQSCASCTYTSRASQCSFHVPNSTKVGVILAEVPSSKVPPKKRSHSKIQPSMTTPGKVPSGKNSSKPQAQHSPVERRTIIPTSKFEASIPIKAVHRPRPAQKVTAPPTAPKPEAPKSVFRSQRYLKALSDAEQMSQEEQQLELADLKFQVSVIGNVIANVASGSATLRYKQAQTEFETMSREEQQLELAGFKFRLSVIQDVLTNKKNV